MLRGVLRGAGTNIGDGQITASKLGADEIGAEQIAGVTTLAATRRLLLAPGESVDLASNGPLTLRAACRT